jgi:hypothetical protein
MNYDIFFISYHESNAEENWERVLSLHPSAIRISNIQGINNAHNKCNELSKTKKFWTIDGDNWLLHKLPMDHIILSQDSDLIYFNSIDPIDGHVGSVGGIKLWTKDKIINNNMSKGDFCKYATKSSIVIQRTLSEHRYNATPFESWCHSFRHMVKCFSGIITKDRLQQNIDIIEKHKSLDKWSYRGYLDAKKYVQECRGDFDKINLINDYDWLNAYVVDSKIL